MRDQRLPVDDAEKGHDNCRSVVVVPLANTIRNGMNLAVRCSHPRTGKQIVRYECRTISSILKEGPLGA
jgi:hypothetical protein